MPTMLAEYTHSYGEVISEICELTWESRSEEEMLAVAWAYYYFSVQFRENLEIACELYPEDMNLKSLRLEECDTDNLSPFPGVTEPCEKVNHDEFMWRSLCLSPIPEDTRLRFTRIGERYLNDIRNIDDVSRALSIASYEDSGLERVFRAILRAPAYENPALNAFRFFLTEHIRFDSNPDEGHGALSRHLAPDDRVVPLWAAFKDLFIQFIPELSKDDSTSASCKMKPVSVNGCFGWLHPAAESSANDVAIVLCPALNRDALDSHHSMRLLADGFAAAGYTTLRFEYLETGDSCDNSDFGNAPWKPWTIWQQNIHDAADWLKQTTGASKLIFCGLRIGATLATLAAETRNDLAGLILLAPVLRGQSYLRQLWVLVGLQEGTAPPMNEGVVFQDLRLSAETVQEISQTDLKQVKLNNLPQIAVFSQSPSKQLDECMEAWRGQGAKIDCAGFDGLEPMLRHNLADDDVPADVSNVVSWVKHNIQAEVKTQKKIKLQECYTDLHPQGCIETPLDFGEGGRLFGMLCHPENRPAELAVIICNAGRDPHYGMARFAVKFARRLAAEGIASLRIDFSGIGDSVGPEGRENIIGSIFETNRASDISAAIDALQHLGFRRFALEGVCSGAYHALHGALADPRIERLLLVNLPVFIWHKGKSAEFIRYRTFSPTHYILKILNKKSWSRLLNGKVALTGLIRAQSERLYDYLNIRAQYVSKQLGLSHPKTFAYEALTTLSGQRTKTFFLFTEGEVGIDEVEKNFGKHGKGLSTFAGASMEIISGFDHLLSRNGTQQKAANRMLDFLVSAPSNFVEQAGTSAEGTEQLSVLVSGQLDRLGIGNQIGDCA